MKKLKTALVFILMLCVLMGGCSLAYSWQESDDGLSAYGVSKGDAFFIYQQWDGESVIAVPDQFDGVPVTRLGGYTGRGYPCPFSIPLPEDIYGTDRCTLSDDYFGEEARFPNGYEIKEVPITVRLGKNVKSLYYCVEREYYEVETEGEKTVFYRPVWLFECADENKTFYAENGILYEKSTGKPAEWKY